MDEFFIIIGVLLALLKKKTIQHRTQMYKCRLSPLTINGVIHFGTILGRNKMFSAR